ncbi:MAG TPA: hypothetical protein VLA56_06500, partial [Pseudomonadales bacterium]|nr:hypothetical protein [Pseudomonadales bacterium]
MSGRIGTRIAIGGVCFALGAAAGWWLRGDAPDPAVVVAARPAAEPGAAPADREDPRLGEFEAALATRAHDRALRIYERVADPGAAPALTAALRARMLDPVRLRRGDPSGLADAVAFLEAFTWLYPRDAEALAVLAEGQERLGRVRAALDAWWQAAEAAGAGPLADAAGRRARALVDGLAASLRGQGDQAALATLYREALSRDPSLHRYRVLLARALEEGGDHGAAL